MAQLFSAVGFIISYCAGEPVTQENENKQQQDNHYDARAKRRFAFTLRIRPGMGGGYDLRHNPVWPEMLDLLKRSGISNYSIFRRDEQLFLVMEADDFEATWAHIEADPINARWQESMAPYFAANDTTKSGERFPMYEEVFFMP